MDSGALRLTRILATADLSRGTYDFVGLDALALQLGCQREDVTRHAEEAAAAGWVKTFGSAPLLGVSLLPEGMRRIYAAPTRLPALEGRRGAVRF